MNNAANKSRERFATELTTHLAMSPRHFARRVERPLVAPSLAAWFLGPKAENEELLRDFALQAIGMHAKDRQSYFPHDPPYITEEIRKSPEYCAGIALLKERFTDLVETLRGSVPFWSYRWQSHMNWDTTLPGMVAYFATMLYNPNNVAAEASPVTTPLEIQVGKDLCALLGYGTHPDPMTQGDRHPWGHLTCDGSVANLEGLWAARNLKYYPFSVALALKNHAAFAKARNLPITLPDGSQEPLLGLDNWKLLNLRSDDVLAFPARLEACGISVDTVNAVLDEYSLQSIGIEGIRRLAGDEGPVGTVLAPATMHYSWPKNAAILGLGKRHVLPVRVDLDARMDLAHFRALLDECLTSRTPIIMVVAVLGSTEESAVDPLADIIALREEYRRRGLEFQIHADAAWGGYFASLLREPRHSPTTTGSKVERREHTPALSMSTYVTAQYAALGRADSITVDPHKAGFLPYPAGGLCYRHSAMRSLVSFAAPVVYHGGIDPTVGIYGVEGSKPGAAAAAVFLSHRIIPLDRTGYGTILGKSLFNSKRLYAALVTMVHETDPFTLACLQRLPAERDGAGEAAIKAQRTFIRERIVPRTNDEILADEEAAALLRELGSDQVILAYAFNFKVNGVLNSDAGAANAFNTRLFEQLSLSPDRDKVLETPLIITSSTFDPAVYGGAFVDAFKRRLGLREGTLDSIDFLISTTMDPWLTNTAEGNFIPTIIEVLRDTVIKTISSVKSV